MYKATEILENLIAFLRRERLRVTEYKSEAQRLEHIKQSFKSIGVNIESLNPRILGGFDAKAEAVAELAEELGYTPKEPVLFIEATTHPCLTAEDDKPCIHATTQPMPEECHGCILEQYRIANAPRPELVVAA